MNFQQSIWQTLMITFCQNYERNGVFFVTWMKSNQNHEISDVPGEETSVLSVVRFTTLSENHEDYSNSFTFINEIQYETETHGFVLSSTSQPSQDYSGTIFRLAVAIATKRSDIFLHPTFRYSIYIPSFRISFLRFLGKSCRVSRFLSP